MALPPVWAKLYAALVVSFLTQGRVPRQVWDYDMLLVGQWDLRALLRHHAPPGTRPLGAIFSDTGAGANAGWVGFEADETLVPGETNPDAWARALSARLH